jgi:putative oxidoreductase
MKKIFSVSYNYSLVSFWLLLLRLAIGITMLTHGYPKLQKLTSGAPIEFADPFGIGATPSFVLVVFAEFFCSILLMLGAVTRIAVLFPIVTMLVVLFYATAGKSFMQKELPLLYLLIYLTILVIGAGKYSIDHLVSNRRSTSKRY